MSLMMRQGLAKLLPVALLGAPAAFAHEGHGAPGIAHWHASDAWGFVIGAVLLAFAIWLGRRK
jgi:hypothetical protein